MADKEELKAEIENYCLKHGYISEQEMGYTMQEQVTDIATHFYNLGRKKEEPVSNSDWLLELQDKLGNATPEQLEELWNKYNGVDEEESVSEDLEEAIKVASEKERMRKAESESPFFMPADFASGFKTGTQWKKEKVINTACKVLKTMINVKPEFFEEFRNNMIHNVD